MTSPLQPVTNLAPTAPIGLDISPTSPVNLSMTTGGSAGAVTSVNGQTGAVTITALVNPMTALGDTMYGGAAGAVTRLPGDTSNIRKFLRELSAAGVAQQPAWDTLLASDIPALVQYALLAGAAFTGFVAPAVATLTFGASIPVNAALGNAFNLTLTASTGTLANPTNPVDGQLIRFRISQDATGGRTLAYGTAYDFGLTGIPTLSTGASKVDIIGFEYVASISKWCLLGSALGFL